MKIKSDNVVYSMSPENKPVAECNPGDEIVFETEDCFGGQIQSEDMTLDSLDWDRINPATGPLKINGTRPGDVLRVSIKKIDIADAGAMTAIPEAGLLTKHLTGPETKLVKIVNDKAVFNENIKLPISPMIGVIGVAPADKAIPCGTPGAHGGNMDNKVIKEGAELYFPVNVPGALLAMGDMHAVMGDGEVVICGVEIAGEVTVRVDVIKNISINNPMVEDDNAFYTVASASTVDNAIEKATDDMFNFLIDRIDLSANEIAMLMSLVCDVQICQVVDPEKTARMRVDKRLLDNFNLTFKK